MDAWQSPLQRVSYQARPRSPVQAVSNKSATVNDHETLTPQRKQRAAGSKKARKSSTAANPRARNKTHQQPQTTASSAPPLVSSGQTLSLPRTPSRPTPLYTPPNFVHPATPSTSLDFGGGLTPIGSIRSTPIVSSRWLAPDRYVAFVEAVFADDCSMCQLDQNLFIVNGWNSNTLESQGWYHLQRTHLGPIVNIVCMCPDWKKDDHCLHAQFLLDYGDMKFPVDDCIKDGQRITFLYSRIEDVVLENTFINHFSVPNHGDRVTVKGRVVVEHRGDNDGSGTWKCMKDSTAGSCHHIVVARNTLQRLISGDPMATDPNATEGLDANTPARSAASVVNSVSYKHLPPPVWARIHGDECHFEPPLLRSVPSLIPLDSSSTCACQGPSSTYNHSKPVERRACSVYGVCDTTAAIIEVQKCPSCRHGYIGPDASDLGIFNLNNRSLFTLTLLDDYTAHFTKSETPFVSWVASTSCRYQNFRSTIPFIKEKIFRTAWFSYARLLQLNDDMRCSKCGPTPKVTIWDGVTLSFSRKNLLATLRPPTTVNNQSETKDGVKAEVGLQFVPDRQLRKDVTTILQGPPLELPSLPADSRPPPQPTQTSINMMLRIKEIPRVTSQLEAMDESLGKAFDKWFGTGALLARRKPRSTHQELFLQLFAEESALQFMNEGSIQNLEVFLREPCHQNVFHLRRCPAVYKAINLDFENSRSLSSEMFGLLQWIFIRSYLALSRLKKSGYPLRSFGLEIGQSWRQTGSCYGMPQIRKRSKYPGLPRDNAADLGGTDLRGEGCQMFYSTYGENRLTGGLMCVWCPHSVCYGFHIIPFAEGRNDVFSAIYTHWETAPDVIVYDFACGLQPYCMVREPEFFSKTLFVIDAFHAKGHVRCGEASFLANYLETNPELFMVNSSAGECGNSGISRIRKSVSYMSQDRAIVYTKVFLSIWNRQRIRRLEGGIQQF